MVEAQVRTLADLPFHVSGRYPKPLLIRRCTPDGYEESSSRQFFEDIRDFGLGLAGLGVRPGDHVALICETRPEWLVADLAILTIGAVTVPIYTRSRKSSTISIATVLWVYCSFPSSSSPSGDGRRSERRRRSVMIVREPRFLLLGGVFLFGLGLAGLFGSEQSPGKKQEATKKPSSLEPLPIELPKPAFKGTPKHAPPGAPLEKARKGPRPEFLAPKGSRLLSKGKPVMSSDREPIIGEIAYATDGDREAVEGSYVELGPGVQHIQIDMQKKVTISAILIWHYHANARIYHDVVIQVSDDRDFISGVQTLFNNDHDNSAGLGLGEDKAYWETYEGKLIDGKKQVARYIRLYSNGSTEDDQNHYTEVEVFGLPAK